MTTEPLKPTGNLVMTPFGEYRLCRFEEWAFKYVYGIKWQNELFDYADSVMEEQWLQAK